MPSTSKHNKRQPAKLPENSESVKQPYGAALKLASSGRMSLEQLITAAEACNAHNDPEQGIALYRAWLKHTRSPLAYAANFNLGVALSNVQDFSGAEAVYAEAIAANPHFIQARLNLGTLLERRGEVDAALDQWRQVLTLGNLDAPDNKPLHVHALNNLGRVLENLKRLREAEQMLATSLTVDPLQPDALLHWVHLRQKQCEWPVFEPFAGISRADMAKAASCLAMLSASNDPAVQLDTAQRFVKSKVVTDVAPLSDQRGYDHGRLRIGYLSSDLHSHAVSILVAELFELHDRQRFEVYAFSWTSEDGSPLRARVTRSFDHYIRIAEMNDEEAARCIRSHEIDILVDLHGLTSGTRPGIISYHPAPVQLTYLGFPGTTALPAIDYVLCDRYVVPEQARPYFTEKPLYLPHCFQVNDRKRAIAPRPTRADCGLPDDAFVFCSFNSNYKFNPEVFAIWMRILQRVPGSVLWLVADNEWAQDNLVKTAEQLGVDRKRLVFATRVPPAEYLARFQVADLFLDTFPFNAGTTSSDALWAGLPVLTCSGRTFASRMAGSLLQAVDLPQLITKDFQEYEELAVTLAQDRQRVEAMKRQLEQSRSTCLLFDTPRWVRDFEQCLEEVALRPGSAKKVVASAKAAVKLHYVGYSDQTVAAMPQGYRLLDNRDSPKNDWREYWPIRNFLLDEALTENCFYGFFSPRFQEKTGLLPEQVTAFVLSQPAETDVVTFSAMPDIGAFFLNIFEQEEVFQPGFLPLSEEFLQSVGFDVDLRTLVMDSRQIVFSNYFVARPAFWRAWLEVNEKLFALCEAADTPLGRALNEETSYDGAVQRKVFLMERIASLLMRLQPQWKVRSYNTYLCAYSASRLNQFKLDAVISDALKIALREHPLPEFLQAFSKVRDRLR